MHKSAKVKTFLKNIFAFEKTEIFYMEQEICTIYISRLYTSFSEGVWGNRSLDSKERFPQKHLNLTGSTCIP